MKKYILIFSSCLIFSLTFAQKSDSVEREPVKVMTYNSEKGKWKIAGEKKYDQFDVLLFSSEDWSCSDTTVFFRKKIWYHKNGVPKKSIVVDFRKRNKAQLVEAEYSEEGHIISNTEESAKREPHQTSYDQINWRPHH